MPQRDARPDAPATRPCVMCQEPIDALATLCVKCKSYQDWSRHVFRWSGLVTAVVALLPLWSMAGSLFQIAKPGEAEIHIYALPCTAKEITVAAANVGKKIGAVAGVDFKVLRDPPLREPERDARTLVTDQIAPIKPNDVVYLKYRPSPDGAGELPLSQGSTRCEYQLTFTVMGLRDAASKKVVVTCRCAT